MNSTQSLRKEAKKLISRYLSDVDMSTDPRNVRIDVYKLAERIGIEVKKSTFSDEIFGLLVKKDNNPVIGVNCKHHPHRQRFTVAHELGHYILHGGETIHYDVGGEPLYFKSDSIYYADEREANRFADELLMPEHLVSRCIDAGMCTVETLSEIFDVSEDTMRYRLINLGYMKPASYWRFAELM